MPRASRHDHPKPRVRESGSTPYSLSTRFACHQTEYATFVTYHASYSERLRASLDSVQHPVIDVAIGFGEKGTTGLTPGRSKSQVDRMHSYLYQASTFKRHLNHGTLPVLNL